jgi:hypothetical protein
LCRPTALVLPPIVLLAALLALNHRAPVPETGLTQPHAPAQVDAAEGQGDFHARLVEISRQLQTAIKNSGATSRLRENDSQIRNGLNRIAE